MAKGGHAASGPAPDPSALRRERGEDRAGWTTLPAAGRSGAAPSWPLSEVTEREGVLWAREWARPQAVMWERNGQQLEVALYVRAVAVAEQLDASVASRTLVRQMQEALGLSVPGLARNRWRIAEMPKSEDAQQRPTRSRLKVVPGGAG